MIVSAIVAIGQNNAIGKNNQLLWHLPNDLKHFKDITSGHTIIMGRKTFDSLGKPLPRRRNIIVTRQDITIEGAEVVHTIDEALALCEGEEEVFIGGGAEIYKMAMPKTDRIYLTIVHQSFDADATSRKLTKVSGKKPSAKTTLPTRKMPSLTRSLHLIGPNILCHQIVLI